jgi:uncharacterized protein
MARTAPGSPNWVDLGTPDLAAATEFYRGLFGWQPQVSPDPQYGGYTIFTLGDQVVAGAGTLQDPQQPTAWTVYFAERDVDAATSRVERAGGKVVMAPMTVGDQGRMAVFLDQAGAAFGVWQPAAMNGTTVSDTPGMLNWIELLTTDLEASQAFYDSVFGWSGDPMDVGGKPYVVLKQGDASVGGLMTGDGSPEAPRWFVYFSVADCDATVARASELGGSVSRPPVSFDMGRYAELRDPQGAVFSIFQVARQQ